jgi:hypothetical protein
VDRFFSNDDTKGMVYRHPHAALEYAKRMARELSVEPEYATRFVVVVDKQNAVVFRVPIPAPAER